MKKMSTYGNGSEDAVSPVIGVILMVAITVILAAVIAAFVFGMAGNVSKTRSVAVTAAKQGANIVLTNNGGPDTKDITTMNWSVDTIDQTQINTANATKVGYTVKNNTAAAIGVRNHVIVTANFNDGTSQVILDTYV
jgi:archaeal type IV pilus assembly protein PilA